MGMSTKMPRKRQPRNRGGNTGSRPVQNEDVNLSTNVQRKRGTRGRGRSSKRTRQESQNEQQIPEQSIPQQPVPEQSRPRRARRPITISLDVTFSSEDEENLPSSPSPPPSDDLNYALTPSPPRSISRSISNANSDIISIDNSDVISTSKKLSSNIAGENSGNESDFIHSSPVPSPVPKKLKSEIPVYDGNSSSDDDDPFAIDYNATKKKAMENACRDFDKLEKEERQNKRDTEKVLEEKKSEEKKLPSDIAEQPELEVIDEVLNSPDVDKQKKKHNDLFFSELGISPVDIISPSKKRVKVNRKTKKNLDQFQLLRANILQEKLNATDDLDNDISIISDEEEDTNAEQTIRIRFGQETLKFTLRRLQKFLIIYQKLAESYGVSVNNVLLSHKDRIVSPESCPADLGVTAGDILEGGIQNIKESDENSATAGVNENNNPDSI